MSRKISYHFHILLMILLFSFLLLGVGVVSLFSGQSMEETFTIILILGGYFAFVTIFMVVKFSGGVNKWKQ